MTLPQETHSRRGFEAEYPFASRYLDFDGVKYHYIDEGHGEPLLCVHGNPTWSFAWRNIIKALSSEYRVIAIDHVGCGFSDKPPDYPYRLEQHVRNLSRFVTELNLRDITLLAHDWGGAIGLGTAEELRDRFSRFALFNTAAFRSQRIPLWISVCRIPIFGAVAVRGLNLFAKAALRMAVTHHERMVPVVRAGYLAPYDSWAHRVAVLRFVQDIPLSPAHPSYATLTAIEERLALFKDAPMLFLWGEQDWCFTTEFLAEFQWRFPHAETLSFPDAGHYVFEDAIERIILRLREFLTAHKKPGIS